LNLEIRLSIWRYEVSEAGHIRGGERRHAAKVDEKSL
jgi:hypothetical protein